MLAIFLDIAFKCSPHKQRFASRFKNLIKFKGTRRIWQRQVKKLCLNHDTAGCESEEDHTQHLGLVFHGTPGRKSLQKEKNSESF